MEPWAEVLSAFTHELRLEVSAILHQVELLSAADLDESARRRSLAAIEANVEGLVRFTDELTELGRLERGDVRTTCRSVDLSELLGTCFDDRAAVFVPNPAAIDAAVVAYTDPLIVDHIIGSVIGEYRAVGVHEGDVAASVVDRSDDSFVDVVFTAGAGRARTVSAEDSWRPMMPDDGVAMFVAHRSAELIGASFGVIGPDRPVSYSLRLPSSPAAQSGTEADR